MRVVAAGLSGNVILYLYVLVEGSRRLLLTPSESSPVHWLPCVYVCQHCTPVGSSSVHTSLIFLLLFHRHKLQVGSLPISLSDEYELLYNIGSGAA